MVRGAISNPYVVVVIVLAVIVIGIASYLKIPADLLPIFKTPAVQIVTFYPGMSPEVMERDIMSRLERWTGQSVGIEHQEGKSMLGVSIVKDFFQEGISLDTAMSQATSYAVSDMFYLPPGTIPPMVMPFDPTAAIPLCLVSVSSPTMNEKELYDIAYFELRNRLQSIQGVIAPAVYGGKLRRILAYVNREKLEARNLSPMDVVRALKQQNVFIPAGNMKTGDLDYQIFANAMPAQVEQINDIPISVRDGSVILLRDVGQVKDSNQIQSNIVRINGLRQVYIPIYRQPGANTIQIVDTIKNNLTRILQRLREMDPKAKDLVLEVVLDQSVYVRNSIRGLQIAGGLGAVLAALIVLIFLRNLRSTFIIVLSIPLSILAAFIGLFYTGDTLNSMTLGGLALAVGILVDQSIVVLENINRHIHMGKTPIQAAYDGSVEVMQPVMVSTITFIVVFYPIVFLTGMAKFLFKPLALAATFSIVASYLLSITLIPAYCAYFFKTPQNFDSNHREGVKIGGFLAAYGKLVAISLRWRYLVYLIVLGLAVWGFHLLLHLGTELFPRVDAGQFQMLVRLPSGTRIEKSEDMVIAIEKKIIDTIGQPDSEYPKVERYPASNLKMLISNIGVLMDWPAAYTPNTGSMDAFILVQLKQKQEMPGTFYYVSKLRDILNQQFPEVEFAFDTGGILTTALNMGEPAPIHIQVSGSNLESSYRIAKLIKREIDKVQGIADPRIAQRLDYPIVDIEIDRIKAAYADVSVDDIMKNLVTATNSSINFSPAFWIDNRNGNHYFIGAQYAESDLVSFDTLLNIPITGSNSGQSVPLRTLVNMNRTLGPAVINHKNITRVIDIYADVLPDYDIGSVVADIEHNLNASVAIKPISKHSDTGDYFEVSGPDYAGKGYTYSLSGEVQTMRNSFRQFAFGLLIATILVYLVMVAQLRSFVVPFVILLTVPLGFIGVCFFLYLCGTAINIQSLMGIIMMVGMVVEYSIVLIDFAERKLNEGLDVGQSIVEASIVRFRPIMMTKLIAIMATLPMAFGFGGGDADKPLAQAIVGGVLGAAVLTLFVVPCFYYTFRRRPAPAIFNASVNS